MRLFGRKGYSINLKQLYMATIKFTAALKQFFPNLEEMKIPGNTVAEILEKAALQYPGLTDYLVDETGALREHMNIFVEGHLIEDRTTLKDGINENDEVLIIQALSGG